MTDDADLMRLLAGLRAQYLAEAPERLAALRSALERFRRGEAPALAELRHLAHRLAGSGGSYGLQAVTDAARAAEAAAYDLQQHPEGIGAEQALRLESLIEGVAAAFREAGASV